MKEEEMVKKGIRKKGKSRCGALKEEEGGRKERLAAQVVLA